MPELPDIELYRSALERRVVGQRLERVRLQSVSLLRTVDPPLTEFARRPCTGVRRLGKRVVLGFEGERFLVIHLMIAGRLRWRPPIGLARRRVSL